MQNIYQLLKTHFGYETFRPLQEEIIQHVLAGNNALVLMPTGGGKSLCFQMPALVLPGITLVVSPLISLMKDQVDALTTNGIGAAYINSTMKAAEIQNVHERVLHGEIRLLYVAPERLNLPEFRNLLARVQVSLLAIDEAHCISEWGHDFRPDYRNLRALREQFPNIPVMALTATATERVRQDILNQLHIGEGRTFISSFNRPNLRYTILPKAQSLPQLLGYLEKYKNQPTIIYCFSRKDTENLTQRLQGMGLRAAAYHAGMNAEARARSQEDFIKDRVTIMVATIAFGMGIDKPDVRLVVHASLPKSLEGYYQETGRAGRDGLPSDCVLFYSSGDARKQSMFFNDTTDEAEREHSFAKLKQMVDFCEGSICRRKYLLEYFGESFEGENCGNCDSCLSPAETYDATELSQKILSAVLRTGERYGSGYIIKLLRGEQDDRIAQLGHDSLSVFGVAQDTTIKELRDVVRKLVSRGLLIEQIGLYPTLFVSGEGKLFLKERRTLFLPKSQAITIGKENKPTSYNQDLFEQLRVLRRGIAEQLNVPPYLVFGDKTLQEMASYFPQSQESFLQLSGVGQQKLASFGEQFLTAITVFAAEHNLQEVPRINNRVAPVASSLSGGTHELTKHMVLQKIPLAEIAKQRNVKEGTIIQHLEILTGQGDVDISYMQIPSERMEIIKQAFTLHGTTALRPVKDELGEDFSYDELRLARLLMRVSP